MPSPKQRQILAMFTDSSSTVTKKGIVNKFGGHYYYAASKYIGEILSRMVEGGLLERVKPGVFKLGKGKPGKAQNEDKNQMSLF